PPAPRRRRRLPFDLATLDAAAAQTPVGGRQSEKDVPLHEHVLGRRSVVAFRLPQVAAVLAHDLENPARLDRGRRGRGRPVLLPSPVSMGRRVGRLPRPRVPLRLTGPLAAPFLALAAPAMMGSPASPISMVTIAAVMRLTLMVAGLGPVPVVAGLGRGRTVLW